MARVRHHDKYEPALHVPTELPDRVAPKLVEHFERVKSHPGVKAYYAKLGVNG
jgi:hypothetical protein